MPLNATAQMPQTARKNMIQPFPLVSSGVLTPCQHARHVQDLNLERRHIARADLLTCSSTVYAYVAN